MTDGKESTNSPNKGQQTWVGSTLDSIQTLDFKKNLKSLTDGKESKNLHNKGQQTRARSNEIGGNTNVYMSLIIFSIFPVGL